jgi:hypothetical protein
MPFYKNHFLPPLTSAKVAIRDVAITTVLVRRKLTREVLQ